MSQPLAADVELLEADVWAEMHGAFAQKDGRSIATVRRWGRQTALATRDVAAVAINRAIGFGFEEPFGADQFRDLRSFYQNSGNTRWFLECSPLAQIDAAFLENAGGKRGGSVIKLVGELDAIATAQREPAIEIVPATGSDAPVFMAIVGAQLGVPELVRPGIVSPIDTLGWKYYLALADGRPIAGAAMYVSGSGAWFGLAGTSREYRNRGAQTALLIRRLQDASRAGCHWVSAETSPETIERNASLHNMKRLGLYEFYRRPWFRFEEQTLRPPASCALEQTGEARGK